LQAGNRAAQCNGARVDRPEDIVVCVGREFLFESLAAALQQLKPLHIEMWHTTLRNGGNTRGDGLCAPRTIGHAHRVLSKALSDVIKNNPSHQQRLQDGEGAAPADDETVIVHDIPDTITKLRNWRLGMVEMISLLTGCRLGEVLALRWSRVRVERKVIEVREALEQTKAHGIRVKSAKSKAGRRNITLPDILVDALRHHRRKQLELPMQLGAGRLPDDALLFSDLDNRGTFRASTRACAPVMGYYPEVSR
jgi:integrase